MLINTYSEDIHLLIDGEFILSHEGDPLAMFIMYAIGTLPLIYQLEDGSIRQVWYADDASAAGRLDNLKSWWDQIVKIGPEYGYFPKASKTWLNVKDSVYEKATSVFQDTGVSIMIECSLGQQLENNCLLLSPMFRKRFRSG